jgi:pimeloyl-ACP methyl ester carboxylesterase
MIPGVYDTDVAPTTSDPEPRLVATAVGSLSITEEGEQGGPTVICVHGIPGSARDFRYLAPLLARRWRVVRVEMPGFGASPRSEVDSLEGWATVPLAVADALKVDRPALLAHSFGGGAAILAAGSSHRVSGLALLASMGARRHRAFTRPRILWRLLTLVAAIPVVGELPTLLARRGYSERGLPPPATRRDLHLQLRLVTSVDFSAIGRAAAAVSARCLVAFCEDDRLVEPAIPRELADLLPDARLLGFPDGGHHLQKHRAAEIAAAVDRVLLGVDG